MGRCCQGSHACPGACFWLSAPHVKPGFYDPRTLLQGLLPVRGDLQLLAATNVNCAAPWAVFRAQTPPSRAQDAQLREMAEQRLIREANSLDRICLNSPNPHRPQYACDWTFSAPLRQGRLQGRLPFADWSHASPHHSYAIVRRCRPSIGDCAQRNRQFAIPSANSSVFMMLFPLYSRFLFRDKCTLAHLRCKNQPGNNRHDNLQSSCRHRDCLP